MDTPAPLHIEAVNRLALAMIASSNAPLLLLDDQLVVIGASASFCQEFDIDPKSVPNQPLSSLGGGEWGVLQLSSLLQATASGYAEIKAYEMDLPRPGQPTRQLVVNAQLLDYGDPEHARLLLTVGDVTDARHTEKLKDDLLREKAVLLQELQHRVANSLQIIASVLMQSARRMQSGETRTHLVDAHQRVMSVASLQRQLSTSSLIDVELKPYFTELCRSIGASMIQDHDEVSITVDADGSVTSPDMSVSLGLIVTELVINALKHAFPARRHGGITVSYRSSAPGWTLSITDDGVGMPKVPGTSKPGLGTSIVQALASQLAAKVEVAAANPGTRVSIINTGSMEQSARAATPV